MNHKISSFGKIHDAISWYPLPLMAALGSTLADIGARTSFFVMTSTASLLFEELSDRVEDLAVDCNGRNLNRWKTQYDLAIQFTELINRCFGPVLLLTCAIDFATPILEFQNIRLTGGIKTRYYLQFVHAIVRFLLILIASYRVESNVTRS